MNWQRPSFLLSYPQWRHLAPAHFHICPFFLHTRLDLADFNTESAEKYFSAKSAAQRLYIQSRESGGDCRRKSRCDLSCGKTVLTVSSSSSSFLRDVSLSHENTKMHRASRGKERPLTRTAQTPSFTTRPTFDAGSIAHE